MIKPKLIIFDLDGTLLNTIDDLAQSVNFVLEKYNYPIHGVEQYKHFVGNGITKLIERAMPESQRTAELISKLQADFVDYYALHGKDHTRPYDGIMELLNELRGRGITLSVASNKHHQATMELIDHYFGRDRFSVVYGKREGTRPKPDPTIVFDIVRECGVSIAEVIYLGDSDTDMQTAQNASVLSVGVAWGFRTQQELINHGAKYIIKTPKELLSLIE